MKQYEHIWQLSTDTNREAESLVRKRAVVFALLGTEYLQHYRSFTLIEKPESKLEKLANTMTKKIDKAKGRILTQEYFKNDLPFKEYVKNYSEDIEYNFIDLPKEYDKEAMMYIALDYASTNWVGGVLLPFGLRYAVLTRARQEFAPKNSLDSEVKYELEYLDENRADLSDYENKVLFGTNEFIEELLYYIVEGGEYLGEDSLPSVLLLAKDFPRYFSALMARSNKWK